MQCVGGIYSHATVAPEGWEGLGLVPGKMSPVLKVGTWAEKPATGGGAEGVLSLGLKPHLTRFQLRTPVCSPGLPARKGESCGAGPSGLGVCLNLALTCNPCDYLKSLEKRQRGKSFNGIALAEAEAVPRCLRTPGIHLLEHKGGPGLAPQSPAARPLRWRRISASSSARGTAAHTDTPRCRSAWKAPLGQG